MRKWEWIAKRLQELDAPEELIQLAKRIDALLVQLYGDKNTREWNRRRRFIDWLFLMTPDRWKKLLIRRVAGSAAFCIACQIEQDCLTCQFAKYAGICLVPGSWFYEFVSHRWWE